jgi:hypothetical protein
MYSKSVVLVLELTTSLVGGVDMAFLKHVPLNVKAMFSIV